MKKSGSSIILNIVAVALLVFTATRTIDLFTFLLPGNQTYMAYVALAAFDAGLLTWLNYFLKGARGSQQRAIAVIMVVVDLVAVVISFGADMFFVANAKGLVHVDAQWTTTVIWALVIVIAANIVAIVACHLLSPENLHNMKLEATNDKIMDEALKMLDKESDVLAAELAPILAQRMIDRQRTIHMTNHIGHRTRVQQEALPEPTTGPFQLPHLDNQAGQMSSKNGNGSH